MLMVIHVLSLAVCLRPAVSLAIQRSRANAPLHLLANASQLRWNTSDDSELAEDTDDHAVWRNGSSLHFTSVGQTTLPPRCPSDIPDDAPYWSEKMWRDRTHTVCEYVDDCNMMITNRERHQSIRNALAMTKQTLDGRSVPYVLYAGSAIGQYRCKDVLPWDKDCDVLIKKSDISKLAAGPLANGFVLRAKSVAIPFAVVDTSTGFYCDIFQMDFEEARGTVAVAWPWAQDGSCAQFPDRSLHEPMHCERYPLEAVYPYATCELNGVQHNCAHDQATYLATKYGIDWNQPDVSTHGKF